MSQNTRGVKQSRRLWLLMPYVNFPYRELVCINKAVFSKNKTHVKNLS